MIQVIPYQPGAGEMAAANLGAGIGGAVEQYYSRKNKERTIDDVLSNFPDLTDEQKDMFKKASLGDVDFSELAKLQPKPAKASDVNQVPRFVRSELKARGIDDPELYTQIESKVRERVKGGEIAADAFEQAWQETQGAKEARDLVPQAPKHRFDPRSLLGVAGLTTLGRQTPEQMNFDDIQKAIPALKPASQTLPPEELIEELQKKGWSPDAIASLMQQEPAPELLTPQGQQQPEALGEVLTPNDQATMAAIEPNAIPAEDRSDLMEAPEEPLAVQQAKARVQAMDPKDIDPDIMPLADLLAISGDQYNALTLKQKHALGKRIGEEKETAFGRELLAGLTLGGSERAAKAAGLGENLIPGEGGKQVARMIGQTPYFAAAGALPGTGPILGAAKMGGALATTQAAERFIEHGEPTSLEQFEKDFGSGMALDLVLRGTGKLVNKMFSKFVKGGTPRNDPKLLEYKKLAQQPKAEKQKQLAAIEHQPGDSDHQAAPDY